MRNAQLLSVSLTTKKSLDSSLAEGGIEMGTFNSLVRILLCIWVMMGFYLSTVQAQENQVQWVQQFGEYYWSDRGYRVATDQSGNIYAASTYWICKYDPEGNLEWQVRPDNGSNASAIIVDSYGSETYVYTAGWKQYGHPDPPHYAYFKGTIEKYRVDGTRVWYKEFGSPNYKNTTSYDLRIDSLGNIYVCGATEDVLGDQSFGGWDIFVSKRNSDGDEIWTDQFGSSAQEIDADIDIDSIDNIYVVCSTWGDIVPPSSDPPNTNTDFVVRKYNSSGIVEWTKQWRGSYALWGYGIAVDQYGYIYVCGYDSYQGIIRKYFANDGSEVQANLFGPVPTLAYDISITENGKIYLCGYTLGTFPGQNNAGGTDIFVSEFNTDLEELWTVQFGTSASDSWPHITSDSLGIYVIGTTNGSFGGHPTLGYEDPFVAKLIPSNAPPVAEAGADRTLSVGEVAEFDGTGSYDPDPDGSIVSYEWDFGDGTTATGPTVTHAYYDKDTYTVTLTVTDNNGASAIDTLTADVVNSPPVAQAGGPYLGTEGTPLFFDGTGSTDPEDNIISYEWDLDGDGVYDDAAGSTAIFTWSDNIALTISLKVTDSFGQTSTATAAVTVGNMPPVIETMATPIDPVPVNTPINTGATFTDPGVLDTHTAMWNWGDGTTSAGVVTETNGSGSVAGSHSYMIPGIYTVILTVTDKDGDTAQASSSLLVVYDPTGGFVTGAGWFESPPGAYSADPALTGRAHFGFVSRYQKGATVPTGQTQFRFQVANLSFQSDTYEWMVVAGARAQYKGTGTINGLGTYRFMIVAIDGQLLGGGGLDKFRIKIWDAATEIVIYDNEMGTSETGDPSTVIGGGNIVIHK